MLKPQEKVISRPGKLAGIGLLIFASMLFCISFWFSKDVISFCSCWIVKYTYMTDFGLYSLFLCYVHM